MIGNAWSLNLHIAQIYIPGSLVSQSKAFVLFLASAVGTADYDSTVMECS
jgi:hypothetical protein